jgi:UDP-N-acetylmuramoyl-tripeptide--D-alanyl-D-alanine ligase
MTALWTADELQIATNGSFVGSRFEANGITIDSRTLSAGDLFFALQDQRDGHNFVTAALAGGATGAVVSRNDLTADQPLLQVPDTLAALGRLGEFARARSSAKIAAVTGSVGKSTTKEMLRRIFNAFGPTHAADASHNNHIGVPLTLARMPRDTAYAVLEIGMNHPGEIAPLAKISRPHVGVITTIAATHIGAMGSLAAIAEEKSDLLRGLLPYGTAVLPRGPFLPIMARRLGPTMRMLTFGTDMADEARLLDVENDPEGVDITARILGTVVRCRLRAPGYHMAQNALAALASAAAMDLDVTEAAASLDGFAPLGGRGAKLKLHRPGLDITILDESYNASGASVRAALEVLALQPGRHIVVLGDMLELGEFSKDEHVALAEPVAAHADLIFACGREMRAMFDLLPPHRQGAWAANAEALVPMVCAALRSGDVLLVKGSHGSGMRTIIAALAEGN